LSHGFSGGYSSVASAMVGGLAIWNGYLNKELCKVKEAIGVNPECNNYPQDLNYRTKRTRKMVNEEVATIAELLEDTIGYKPRKIDASKSTMCPRCGMGSCTDSEIVYTDEVKPDIIGLINDLYDYLGVERVEIEKEVSTGTKTITVNEVMRKQ